MKMLEQMKSIIQTRLKIMEEQTCIANKIIHHQLPLALAGTRPIPESELPVVEVFDVKKARSRIAELTKQLLENSKELSEFDTVDGANALLICSVKPTQDKYKYWNNVVYPGMDKGIEDAVLANVNRSPLPTFVTLFDRKCFTKDSLQYVMDIIDRLEVKEPVVGSKPVPEQVHEEKASFDHKEAFKLGKELNRMLFFTCIQQGDVIGAKIKPDTTDTERLTSLFGHPAIAVICGKIDYQSFASLYLDEDLRDTSLGYMAMGPCGTIVWYRENKFLNLFTLNEKPLTGTQVARYVAGYFNHDVAQKEIHG